MAVNYVKGQILSSILERDGIDISIANANVGIGTVSPSVKLEIAGNVILGNLSTAGNVATGNLLTDNLLYANGTPWDLQQPAGNNTEIQFNDNSNFGASANLTFDTAGNLLTVNATANIANLNVAGNIVGGNVSTTGNVYATNFIGNISGNLNAPGANTEVIFNDAGMANAVSGFTFDKTSNSVSVSGNITGANIFTGGQVSATGAVTAGGFTTVGNVTAGNVLFGSGTVSGTGNIYGGNIFGNVLATVGNIANLRLANTTITTDATIGNIVLEPTSTGVVYINTTTGLIIPVGNTLQRPAPATQGTVRFNTTTSRVEVYDGSEWDTIVGGVTNQILNGDGSTLTFVLDRSTTTAAVLVVLNGITQVPTQAYNMSPNPSVNLVFTEAPQVGDVIDIRFL